MIGLLLREAWVRLNTYLGSTSVTNQNPMKNSHKPSITQKTSIKPSKFKH